MSIRMAAVAGALALLGVAFSSSSHADPLIIEAKVDTTYCASGGIQCTVPGTGHTAEAANDANHNPLRMFVHVVTHAGITPFALTDASFNFSNSLYPAGGAGAELCDVATCTGSTFQNGGSGLYALFLDLGTPGNWKAGTYGATVHVEFVNGATTYRGTAIVTFTIPEAGVAARAD